MRGNSARRKNEFFATGIDSARDRGLRWCRGGEDLEKADERKLDFGGRSVGQKNKKKQASEEKAF